MKRLTLCLCWRHGICCGRLAQIAGVVVCAIALSACAALFGGTTASPPALEVLGEKPPVDTAPSSTEQTTPTDSSPLASQPLPLDGAILQVTTQAIEVAATALDNAGLPAPRTTRVIRIRPSQREPETLGARRATMRTVAELNRQFTGMQFLEDSREWQTEPDWLLVLSVDPTPESLCARVIDRASGRVLASRRQTIDTQSMDRVPRPYFRDLPVTIGWPDLFGSSDACGEAEPTSRTRSDLRAALRLETAFAMATMLYDEGRYEEAKVEFRRLLQEANQAGGAITRTIAETADLHAHLGFYLSTWRLILNRGAEPLLRPLVTRLFDAHGQIALNLYLSPVGTNTVGDKQIKSRQTEWLIEVSRLLRRERACARVVGHATDAFVDRPAQSARPLALEHARWVEGELRRHSSFAPDAITSMAADDSSARPQIGDPSPSTGDARDEWRRRVVVIRTLC